MTVDVKISSVHFMASAEQTARSGLLGWIRMTVNDALCIDGVALRRTVHGRLTLSFPLRKDAHGKPHAIVRPIDDAVRREIEAQVFEALGLSEETPR